MKANALTVLAAIRRAGGDIRVIGEDRLKVLAPAALLPEFVARARAAKPELLAALASDVASGTGQATQAADLHHWRKLFEERCLTRRRRAGYSKPAAMRLAWGEVVETWCDLHPLPLVAGRCAGCGKPLGPEILDLPDGAQVHFEPEREFACLIAYGFARKHRAVEALAALGLHPPEGGEVA
jgi:hypothetical protein